VNNNLIHGLKHIRVVYNDSSSLLATLASHTVVPTQLKEAAVDLPAQGLIRKLTESTSSLRRILFLFHAYSSLKALSENIRPSPVVGVK
jgi:hypothetical protein